MIELVVVDVHQSGAAEGVAACLDEFRHGILDIAEVSFHPLGLFDGALVVIALSTANLVPGVLGSYRRITAIVASDPLPPWMLLTTGHELGIESDA